MTSARRNSVPLSGEVLAIAAVFFAGAASCLTLTHGMERIAPLWLPNGLMFAWLLWRPRLARADTFIAAWLGNVAANLLFGDRPLVAVGLALSNSVEVALALALAIRAEISVERMGSMEQQLRLILCCGIVAPAFSALTALPFLQFSTAPQALSEWSRWLITDGLGMVLIGSTTGVFLQSLSRMHKPSRGELIDWTVLTVIGTTVTLAAFAQSRLPILFLVTPVVIVHAVRHGLLGTAISTIKIALIAISATLMGYGPIMLVADPWLRIAILQLFLVTVFLMGFPIAALLRREQIAAQSLVRRDAQLALIAASMSDAVLVFDDGLRCTLAAGAAESLIGIPEDLIVGSTSADLIVKVERDRFDDAIRRIVERKSCAEAVTFRSLASRGSGQDTFIEARLAPARQRDGVEAIEVIATLRDVSERVVLERDLIEARERAEQAALAKSRFLANMSHEIRTPMNGVLGFAELLQHELADPSQRGKADRIVESGQLMMRLLNDILDLSKIESGLIEISDEPLALATLVSECCALQQASAMANGISLQVEHGAGVPEFILGDSFRIKQILLNLLGNAIKFTEHGTVTVTLSRHDTWLSIDISDTGIGIPPDRLEAIFLPFEQADNAISRRFGGTGLGLAISRHLAGLMGGTLHCVSEVGCGSSFRLTLPLQPAAASLASLPVERAIPGEHGPGPGRVLLVDDHAINRELAEAMLIELGQMVDLATNGEEAILAIQRAEERGEPFQLVLMDVQMPVCDGYCATRMIRELGYDGSHLPIIAITANAFPEDVRAAHDAGMQDHLAKPITLSRLQLLLARWIPMNQPDSSACTLSVLPGEKLARLWDEARSDALNQARASIEFAEIDAHARSALQRTMHRIAGTALHFGEGALGEAAGDVDRAIESGYSHCEIQAAIEYFIVLAGGFGHREEILELRRNA